MDDATSAFAIEVQRFRVWAAVLLATPMEEWKIGYSMGEWECEYEDWEALNAATESFVDERSAAGWTDEEWSDVLYVIARDNENERIVDWLVERHPEMILTTAGRWPDCGEHHARWQLASALSKVGGASAQREQLLLRFAEDEDAYVRRRALGALGAMGSSETERLALRAWAQEDDQPWARMMALRAMERISAPALERMLAVAETDGNERLADFAQRLRSAIADGAIGSGEWS
jgi:hypothetical protein